jgi:hypothetical protein
MGVNVYSETNLWNALCDHPGDPDGLVQDLESQDLTLVFSDHCVTEMKKTFMGYGTASDRGRQLFSSLRRFMNAGARCAKQNMEFIPAELTALTSGREINPFIPPEQLAELQAEVDKLAEGIFDDKARASVEDRIAFAKRTRQGQIDHLALRPDMKEQLKAIGPDAFPAWLEQRVSTLAGQEILAYHIRRMYPDAPPEEAFLYAGALLRNPVYRFARGVVRAELYYNWRCAHRGSNRPDLVDDMFHVLNAIYCDVYVSKEKNQIEYAGLLLGGGTKVEIFDGSPVDQWLAGLRSGRATQTASA